MMIAIGIAEAIKKSSVIFSLTWLMFYVFIGTWIKGYYSVIKTTERKYKPLLISHLLFSLVFLNPWVIAIILWNIGSLSWLPGWLVCLILYLCIWLFSILVDLISIHYLPKWKYFNWMASKVLKKRYIWIQSALVIAGILLGSGVAQIIL